MLNKTYTRALQIIYDRFYTNNPSASTHDLNTDQVIRFLQEKSKLDTGTIAYNEMISAVSSLKSKEIPPSFIELSCIAKIANQLIDIYPINIAEAFILGYLILNEIVLLSTLYFKLGISGLITPTIINGTKIQDVEAIAQFMINSLKEVELIAITENDNVMLGKQFSNDFPFV